MASRIRITRTSRPSRVAAVAGYRPRRSVPNDEVAAAIDSSDEWIRERSQITSRRFAAPDETIVAMGAAAGAKALSAAGLTGPDVDCVVLATMSYLLQAPPVAPQVADRVGAAGAAAFDVSVGCAGFCYALSVAADAVRSGSADTVLVVGSERMSDIVDPTDRSTAFLFGDGAGAAVVTVADEDGIGPVAWGADGSRAELIEQVEPWSATAPHVGRLRMSGPEVFRWAVTEVADVAARAVEAAGVRVDQLAAFVPHQANGRIVDALARKLGLPPTVALAKDLTTEGNTSAASIPLAMERLLATGRAHPGDLALLVGFGSGLAYAAQVVVLP